jgi:tetratricopeptide (TPR) repeat protein
MLFLLIGLAIGVSQKEWNLNLPDKFTDGAKFISGILFISMVVSMVIFVILPVVEFKKWGKVISTNSMNERIKLREGIQGISLFGGVSDDAYISGKFYNLYKTDINNINDSNRDLYIKEIQSVVNQVDRDMNKQPNDIYSHIVVSQLLNMEIFIKGQADIETWNQSYDNIQKALNINPQNPEIYLLLAQTYILRGDLKNAYVAVRQAISIAPTYTKSYDYARKLLKIKNNVDFQKYVDGMEKEWVNPAITN